MFTCSLVLVSRSMAATQLRTLCSDPSPPSLRPNQYPTTHHVQPAAFSVKIFMLRRCTLFGSLSMPPS